MRATELFSREIHNYVCVFSTFQQKDRDMEQKLLSEPRYIVSEAKLRRLIEKQVCSKENCIQPTNLDTIEKIPLPAAIKLRTSVG